MSSAAAAQNPSGSRSDRAYASSYWLLIGVSSATGKVAARASPRKPSCTMWRARGEAMGRYFCHEHPDVLSLETRVVDARPGAVVLEQTPFYPGGGGQLADRGTLRWNGGEVAVTGFEPASDGRLLAPPGRAGRAGGRR